jgi:hypothetical protein
MSAKAHFLCEFGAPEQGGLIGAHFPAIGSCTQKWVITSVRIRKLVRCTQLAPN